MLICWGMDLVVPSFQHVGVFHTVSGISEDIEMMPSLHMAQVVAELAAFKLTTLQAKLVIEAMIAFVEQESIEVCAFSILKTYFKSGMPILSKVATRLVHKQ